MFNKHGISLNNNIKPGFHCTYHPYDDIGHSEHTMCIGPALTNEPQMKPGHPEHRLYLMQTQNHLRHCHGSDKSGSHRELDRSQDILLSASL
jgi:hypothetical protein